MWVEGLKADGTWNLSNSLLYLCIFYTCANEKYNFVRTEGEENILCEELTLPRKSCIGQSGEK